MMQQKKYYDLPCFSCDLAAIRLAMVVVALAMLGSSAVAQDKPESLFDGRSLDGWEVLYDDRQWWTVADGALTGGSLSDDVPHNTFASTKESFQNFELILKIRIRGAGGFINSGIQIRSVRASKGSEMVGYQVDAGDGWWGKMYDESRRNKVISQAADLNAINQAIRKDDWNVYRIRAEGTRIRSWINGVPAIDYIERDGAIPLDGHIGIQVHSGGKALVQVKEVTIERLPPTRNAPTWKKLRESRSSSKTTKNKVAAQMSIQSAPRSPAEELKGFSVPEGFEVELVASEADGIGKFVAIAFDTRGRMWTMTALEYPVDANENEEASRQLFASGGRDKVLVFDQPFGKQVSQPRVFAEGLVMPLGILPYQEGVYVQYGNDIRFYRDTNGDGKSDKHEVILTGFGTQDSHLFPHQFTRAPGGWILTAQGLFNTSKVRRPNGEAFADGKKEIAFKHCKLGRFRHDGSGFEALTSGPNNIWGLTISREGETWIQEANDIGYPIIPFEPGGYYATGSKDRLRPYQPLMPPTISPPQMGGTGLSGLTLADDLDGWPSPWGRKNTEPSAPKLFYVANPITSRIQVIRATPQGERYRYEKLPDFLTSEDPKFRPVAVQFGPDGCLYITDWYNKIISHNEVPRNHPERDKTRGRIWRVRHKSQLRAAPPKLSELASADLIAHLGSPNARTADMAWQEIIDRRADELAPKLKETIEDKSLTADKRLGALWALEGLTTVPTSLLELLSKEKNAHFRHEAIRIAASQPRPSSEFLAVASALVEDPSPKVRAALGDALRRVPASDPAVVALILRLGKAPLHGDLWASYDREFERYLARWAMEQNSETVGDFLNSADGMELPLENRVLATLSLGGRQSAIGLARLMGELKRPLTLEEIKTLANHFDEPKVSVALVQLLESPKSRDSTLQTLLTLRPSLDTTSLRPAIESATQALWKQADSDQARELALRVAGAFQLKKLDPSIANFASSPETTQAFKLAALRALRELGSSEFETLAKVVTSNGESQAVRDAALAALADSPSSDASATLGGLLRELNFEQRKPAIARMATSRNGALALLAAVDGEDIPAGDLSPAILETIIAILPDNEDAKNLWSSVAGQVQRVLQLSGGNADSVEKPITLSGAFTVETWVRLQGRISSADGILGRPNVLDMNFYDEMFRVWCLSHKNIVIAKKKIVAGTWTHLAVTRDTEGRFRIYINGELSAESTRGDVADFSNLRIGQTTPSSEGTKGSLTEFRIWNVARTPQQIRDNFDRSFVGEANPDGLVHYLKGPDWGQLSGKARVQPTLDVPKLITAKQAKLQAELFAKYRQLAERPGNLKAGKALFTKSCLVCHQQGGKGGNIGPPLDGIGLSGTETLLRNILTPSAAMEGGYRMYRAITVSGQIAQGMLVSQDDSAVVLRQPDTADKRISKSDIESAGFLSVSVMPDGLLDSFKDEEVSDLFSYLNSLKQGNQ
ncbi:MAG: DUF1080 domain-containing protein [Planctomycetes bacterium]|nr:DUF1080 domain-containing protein [Planctomycetota bacterium]